MSYVNAGKSNKIPLVDLRSDTVTKPTEGMRAAMLAAPVGDDVYGDDPTVNELQERAARLLGKEATLFMSSGTQSNLVAMLAHCQRGEEILCGADYHVFIDEAGGASVLGGIMFAPMAMNSNGSVDPETIKQTIKPDDEHCPISRMLSLENSWHGRVQPLSAITAAARCGREYGLVVHLDGARMMNAVTRLGISPSELVADVDTVSLCLSKGLGAPVGTSWPGQKHSLGARTAFANSLAAGCVRRVFLRLLAFMRWIITLNGLPATMTTPCGWPNSSLSFLVSLQIQGLSRPIWCLSILPKVPVCGCVTIWRQRGC